MNEHKVEHTPRGIAGHDGYSFLQELPEDVVEQLSAILLPKDLCTLSLTCKTLHALCSSDKFWWIQCRNALSNCTVDLQAWRTAMPSYKAIFRFIKGVIPLLGIWVHQNPELGNMVYVIWGFLSVVGCRIIPQELGLRGFETGLLWAPVFEIISDSDGDLIFFLHGREKDKDFCYPGYIDAAAANCNVLLLEAEPRGRSGSSKSTLVPVQADNGEFYYLRDEFRKLSQAGTKTSKMKDNMQLDVVPFHHLHFADRRKLLEAVACHVRLEIPKVAIEPLFPNRRDGETDVMLRDECHTQMLRMSERRSLLLWMHSHGDPTEKHPSFRPYFDGPDSRFLLEKMCIPPQNEDTLMAFNNPLEGESSQGNAVILSDKNAPSHSLSNGSLSSLSHRKSSLAKVIRQKLKQIIGLGQGQGLGRNDGSGTSAMKRLLLQQFLRQCDTVALRLHATFWNISRYRAWPLMYDNRFALYKMPVQKPEEGREYTGLWGGTFGWPPGKVTEDKSGKALYVLLLSYDDSEEGRLLIATKILEGTHYVVHPNGSPMFTVKVDEPSSEPFPWHAGRDDTSVDIVHAYHGEGIANGYGFRYPGSKPGDLFIERKGLLAFVWRDSQAVLTLQRLDLQMLLEKGERVSALPPISNFVYLTKSYSNVFANYSRVGVSAKI